MNTRRKLKPSISVKPFASCRSRYGISNLQPETLFTCSPSSGFPTKHEQVIVNKRRRKRRLFTSRIVSSHRPKTLITPSPPAPTTHRPSALQTTLHTPSPLMIRRLVISCVHVRFSKDQKRKLASWPPLTSSAPEGDRLREEIADGWASMLYVH